MRQDGQNLNDLMEFDHVVLSDGTGYVTDSLPRRIYAPEGIYGDMYGDNPDESVAECARQAGWQIFSEGYTGQYGGGDIMHNSEFIGGRLEHDIRCTPGYYVACVVSWLEAEESDENETYQEGWVVLRKPLTETAAKRLAEKSE